MKETYTLSTVEFDKIYGQYHVAVYKNISKYIQDAQIAEDIFQEVFMRFWESLKLKKPIQSYSSWLYVVSHNAAISHIQKALRSSKVLVSQEISEIQLQDITTIDETLSHETAEEQLQLLYRVVEQLPKQKRTVFCLNKFEGKEIDEIAEIMDISPLSVKEYLKQATRMIKNILSQHTELAHNAVIASMVLCYAVL